MKTYQSGRPDEHHPELQELPVLRHASAARPSRWRNECGWIEERPVLLALLPGRALQHARPDGRANARLSTGEVEGYGLSRIHGGAVHAQNPHTGALEEELTSTRVFAS